MDRFIGTTVLLTGGGGGIAKGSAIDFAREGAKVALLEIDREAGMSAAEDIRSAGGEALFIETDVTDEDSVKAAISRTVENFGVLNVVVNCTGGSSPDDKAVHEMDMEVWMRTVKLNLLSAFLVSKYAIPHLMEAGGGAVVNFASFVAMMGSGRPAYAASKGGIVALTQTMAAQYAPHNIRVNAVVPGQITTKRTATQHQTAKPEYLAYLQKRQEFYPFSTGRPEDVAKMVLFLASDDSRMMTGTTIRADGGASNYFKIS